MRRIIVLTTFSLLACDDAYSNGAADVQSSVYDLPVPDRNDVEGIRAIGLALRSKDQNTWRNIMNLPRNTYRPEMTSATVGEALRRYEAYVKCVSVNGTHTIKAKLGEPPVDKTAPDYKKKIAAYDAAVRDEMKVADGCAKLPV